MRLAQSVERLASTDPLRIKQPALVYSYRSIGTALAEAIDISEVSKTARSPEWAVRPPAASGRLQQFVGVACAVQRGLPVARAGSARLWQATTGTALATLKACRGLLIPAALGLPARSRVWSLWQQGLWHAAT
ncbi:hypothetical protein HLB44_36495 [Aquincola sp. S2]|uniref:Uncharacterized protein n=1 Tax=Pseudaquabacterium terrae TaxID=2732868 RepID=A0ABX2EV93_9BURK|nr:hypothetical protein [Aquabacterium terrae]NRF72464.1 hypothetical protein [Aquabacterium terrae]